MKFLQVPEKEIRARVIYRYMHKYGMKVVCFTCGNAANALRVVFPAKRVLEVGPKGPITPTRWWSMREISDAWPDHFDATSGHLPSALMWQISYKLKGMKKLEQSLTHINYVPTGSGETITCLRMAFPEREFVAVYNVKGLERETQYHPQAVLTPTVASEGKVIHL